MSPILPAMNIPRISQREGPCSKEPAPFRILSNLRGPSQKGPRKQFQTKEGSNIAMKQETKIKYLEEVQRHLQTAGFTTQLKDDQTLEIKLDGKPLCRINAAGGIGYFEEDTTGKDAVLDRVRDTARSTKEYMTLLEQAPPLAADGLGDGYKLLAEFNGTVLAGHMTQYGAQFITWDRANNGTSLWQGHYYGVGGDSGGYQSAKRDFTARSGLIPSGALFTPEQLTEVYRSIHETLDGIYPITDERRKLLESAARQIEDTVPDLDERVDISNVEEMGVLDSGGMELR